MVESIHRPADYLTTGQPGRFRILRVRFQMTRTQQVIADSGMTLTAREIEAVTLEATRATNMTGGRYSDHLRSELAALDRMGLTDYLKLHTDSTRIARQLSY